MRPPLRVRSLAPTHLSALAQRYRQTANAAERTRCQIILLSHEGHSPPRIARLVRLTAQTVRRTLRRYTAKGLAGLADRPRPGRPRTITPAWHTTLLWAVEQDPHRCGVSLPFWSAPALAAFLTKETGIRVGEERVRHYLHHAGFAPRRPTWTVKHLATRQPDYAQKKRRWKRSSRNHRRMRMSTSKTKSS